MAAARPHEVKGLDTLRFVAAATVALSHGAAPPLADIIGKGAAWSRAATALWGVSFDGVAAVIIFFVISGFCIHHGPATGAPFRVLPFWTRRGVRILGPLIGAVLIADLLGAPARAGLGAVIWSVYCELIYYAIYPLLRIGFRRFGIGGVLIASSVLSVVVIGVGWNERFYWSFPVWLTWIVGAPAWLLGCLLAEQVARGVRAPRLGGIWTWRALVWGYATLALAAFFHGPIHAGYPALLFPFQWIAYLWVLAEIGHFERAGVSRLLEWCGRWSYSLYLIHNIVFAVMPLTPGAIASSFVVRVAAVLGATLAFYFVVEAPSHWAARISSRKVTALLAKTDARRPQLASS
ncbi:MAG TPA: acyltransferase [Caulobacteraceae bacterium]|jgi:peptidoglycan/LPS O-acetylase OafA/YrhL